MSRLEQAQETIHRALSDILERELECDPGVMVTVSSVGATPDKAEYRVGITVFPEQQGPYMLGMIKKRIPYFRSLLGGKIRIKTIPELLFVLETYKESNV